MTLDILFVAKNRLEFTREALAALLANTNWKLVKSVVIYDDGSIDGTADLIAATWWPVSSMVVFEQRHGSPAAIMNKFARIAGSLDVFAKIDSDTIVPPGWLDACWRTMVEQPELDLLGIEPPASRVPHYEGGRLSPTPELTGPHVRLGTSPFGYAPCDSIGGIGLMRTRAFLENEPLRPHSTYGGFTEWQLEHPKIRKGWIVPPLDVFLLDRLNFEPWISLSKQYEAKGWQRPWSKYPVNSSLWRWWTPVGEELGVAAASAPPPSGAGASNSATDGDRVER